MPSFCPHSVTVATSKTNCTSSQKPTFVVNLGVSTQGPCDYTEEQFENKAVPLGSGLLAPSGSSVAALRCSAWRICVGGGPDLRFVTSTRRW